MVVEPNDNSEDGAAETGPVAFIKGEARMDVVALKPAGVRVETRTYVPESAPPGQDPSITPYQGDEETHLVEVQHGPATEATFLVAILIGDKRVNPSGDRSLLGRDSRFGTHRRYAHCLQPGRLRHVDRNALGREADHPRKRPGSRNQGR
jgi:hypothetical protein